MKKTLGGKWTAKEKDLLKLYTGSGGLEKGGAEGRGLLDEYYTPPKLVNFIWDKITPLIDIEARDLSILEPSAGIGGFFEPAPEIAGKQAFEINETSAEILKVLYP